MRSFALLYFVFCLAERKKRNTAKTASTMLPQAKRRLCVAPRSSCDVQITKRRTIMSRTKAQALLDELQQYTNAVILGEKPDPLKQFSGAVDGGPALLVENTSAAHASVGIEVHVGQEDAEVRNFALSATADQQGGIGVIGRGDFGVVGQSPDNVGVMGFGTTGIFGFSNDPAGCGVEGHTASPSGIGVRASAPAPEITALAIDTGNIRVPGAGQNTPTPVFVHIASETNTRDHRTIIDHPMTNGDPNAILIVTRRMGPNADLAGSGIASFGVGYNAQAGKWMIGQPSGQRIASGAAFNVLVFKG
jgi:hypothetical protein